MTPSLIVSYSYSGNTHQIAQKLQEVISGDWCETVSYTHLDVYKRQGKRCMMSGIRHKLQPSLGLTFRMEFLSGWTAARKRSEKQWKVLFAG